MAGTFVPRTNELLAQVGEGPLEMRCKVDQVYARYQHEGLSFKHPRGGRAKYLEAPMFERHGSLYQKLANDVLSNIRGGAIGVAEDLSSLVYDNAPVEFDQLRRSGNPIVVDNGAVIYNRPPQVPRLSEDALRAKSRLRGRRGR